MERAPSRAKATNILRPASRAQGVPFTNAEAPPHQGLAAMQLQPGANPVGMPSQIRPLGGVGGARLLIPSAGMQMALSGNQPSTPGGLRRPPSSGLFVNPQMDQAYHTAYAMGEQLAPGSAGGNARQRVNSYYDGMPTVDVSAMPRSASRTGSRPDMSSPALGMQQQQLQLPHQQHHQLPPRASSRAGHPGTAPGGMWAGGPVGQMGLTSFFGGGFGSMGGDMGGMRSPMTPQPQQQHLQQQPMNMLPPGGRPGSAMQVSHPSRPSTSTGHRTSAADPDSPVVVNVARGGARVIGPMRSKAALTDNQQHQPFLNTIPQSPSSALGGMIPGSGGQGSYPARDHLLSALSNKSIESTRSRSNSAVVPTEGNMEAAEARVSRKIQDLEISNKSLLAVNTQLESRVKAQREQITELKKQLQSNVHFDPDTLLESDISDEALRSALKEDKVFERLLSNLEQLIQDAKDALEYRSTIAAGKVISAAELTEDDSQLTVGKIADRRAEQSPDDAGPPNDRDVVADDNNDSAPVGESDGNVNVNVNDKAVSEQAAVVDAGNVVLENEKLQEARELIARLMVLALSSPEPETPDKPSARAPRRTGSAAAVLPPTAKPAGAPKGGLRTPAKSSSTRISSFGVASENNPVRSLVVSPSPASKANSGTGKDAQSTADKEQILDICRKLQLLL
ncbi:hypothetical protein IW146_007967 [Coemansia sp. RSA 922]|nr:hypothetical protein GGH13_003015 [Coemansia sp. S155-1]KAJ2106030.1 hypothetical protein IW146_007967 [Coemansia sp. RSA 922]